MDDIIGLYNDIPILIGQVVSPCQNAGLFKWALNPAWLKSTFSCGVKAPFSIPLAVMHPHVWLRPNQFPGVPYP